MVALSVFDHFLWLAVEGLKVFPVVKNHLLSFRQFSQQTLKVKIFPCSDSSDIFLIFGSAGNPILV